MPKHEGISFTNEEIEDSRIEAIKNKIAENKEIKDREAYDVNAITEDEFKSFYSENQPGSYSCHEALNHASIVHDLSARFLESSAILANPEWYILAHDASTYLFNLYQAIGAVHLEAIPDNIIDLIELAKKEA